MDDIKKNGNVYNLQASDKTAAAKQDSAFSTNQPEEESNFERLKKRVKEHPEDMIILSELMKRKY